MNLYKRLIDYYNKKTRTVKVYDNVFHPKSDEPNYSVHQYSMMFENKHFEFTNPLGVLFYLQRIPHKKVIVYTEDSDFENLEKIINSEVEIRRKYNDKKKNRSNIKT